MDWKFSKFGLNLACGSGIGELMEDLGHALAVGGDRARMLGGGQPSHLPEVDATWRARLEAILDEPGRLEQILGDYEPPAGNLRFRTAIASRCREEFGWQIGPENVAVTAGGQTTFFFLINALAGKFPEGRRKHVLLPVVPEYIGYANQPVDGGAFRGVRPIIEDLGGHQFKYHVDFEHLELTGDTAAICVSRPTNPTGNVLTDDEVFQLSALARERSIPLIVDCAYGSPFPNVMFREATPIWDRHLILSLSLSKIGLPGTRTGIVIADDALIQAIASMTSIVGLANPNIGQAIATPLIESGELFRLAREVVRPFYEEKSRRAMELVAEFFDDSLPYRVHRSEGAFFLWFWFEGLPISSAELYRRLKERNVLVVPGHFFFFGLDEAEPWRHREECLRVSFSMPEEIVRDGLRIIADEVSRAYRG